MRFTSLIRNSGSAKPRAHSSRNRSSSSNGDGRTTTALARGATSASIGACTTVSMRSTPTRSIASCSASAEVSSAGPISKRARMPRERKNSRISGIARASWSSSPTTRLYHSTIASLAESVAVARPKRRTSTSKGLPSSAAVARMPSTCSASCAAASWRARPIDMTGASAIICRPAPSVTRARS